MNASFVIKVADFEFTHSEHHSACISLGLEEGVTTPVKWMAIESYRNGTFTEKTDVVR